jgi:hypothetical protein
MVSMTTDEDDQARARADLIQAHAECREVEERCRGEVERAREMRDAAIVVAARAKVRQKDIAEITEFSREYIRQKVRAAGLEDTQEVGLPGAAA